MAAIRLIRSIAAFPEYCFPPNGFPTLFICKCRKHVAVVTWVSFPSRHTSSLYGHYIASLPSALTAGSSGYPKCVQCWCAMQSSLGITSSLLGLTRGALFPLLVSLSASCFSPLPVAPRARQQQLRRCRTPKAYLNEGVPSFFAAARDRGKVPTNPAVGNPPDQLSTISLLLLVDPEVTDIERRAIETSL